MKLLVKILLAFGVFGAILITVLPRLLEQHQVGNVAYTMIRQLDSSVISIDNDSLTIMVFEIIVKGREDFDISLDLRESEYTEKDGTTVPRQNCRIASKEARYSSYTGIWKTRFYLFVASDGNVWMSDILPEKNEILSQEKISALATCRINRVPFGITRSNEIDFSFQGGIGWGAWLGFLHFFNDSDRLFYDATIQLSVNLKSGDHRLKSPVPEKSRFNHHP